MPPPTKRVSKAAAAAKKQKQESSDINTATLKVTLVTDLGPNDVLMGRGAMATDYEGNSRLRQIVHQRHEEYTTANKRNRKHRIAEEIVSAVLARGGRFLQSAETLAEVDASALPRHVAAWYIVKDQSVLVAKVKQLLRDVKPSSKNKDKQHPPDKTGKVSNAAPVLFTPSAATTNTTTTTTNTTTTSTTSHPHPSYMWQQPAPPVVAPVAQRATLTPSISSQASHASLGSQGSKNNKSPGMAPVPTSSFQNSFPSQVTAPGDQPHANVAKSTTMLGQTNASVILNSLSSGKASRDQQYDALLALSLASRLAPASSTAPMAARQATGPMQGVPPVPHIPQAAPPIPPYAAPHAPVAPPRPAAAPAPPPSDTTQALAALAAALVAQQQQREREHALVDTLLSHLLPKIQQESKPAPPPTERAPTHPDPSMAWLFEQLKSREHERKQAPSPANTPNYDSLTAFLHKEHEAPRSKGILGNTTPPEEKKTMEPSRLAVLERLLLSRNRWSQQPQQPPQPPAPAPHVPVAAAQPMPAPSAPPAAAPSNAEDPLAQFLRALQGQYFHSPSS